MKPGLRGNQSGSTNHKMADPGWRGPTGLVGSWVDLGTSESKLSFLSDNDNHLSYVTHLTHVNVSRRILSLDYVIWRGISLQFLIISQPLPTPPTWIGLLYWFQVFLEEFGVKSQRPTSRNASPMDMSDVLCTVFSLNKLDVAKKYSSVFFLSHIMMPRLPHPCHLYSIHTDFLSRRRYTKSSMFTPHQ